MLQDSYRAIVVPSRASRLYFGCAPGERSSEPATEAGSEVAATTGDSAVGLRRRQYQRFEVGVGQR